MDYLKGGDDAQDIEHHLPISERPAPGAHFFRLSRVYHIFEPHDPDPKLLGDNAPVHECFDAEGRELFQLLEMSRK
jgi:hypothetical protein